MANQDAGDEDVTRFRWCPLEEKDRDILRTVVEGLNELWTTGALSDVTLKADGQEFQAHRVVLAAASTYFLTMFSGVWAENGEKKPIELRGVTAVGLQHILKFIYRGALKLDPSNAFEVLLAADHLQVKPAVHLCIDYMVSHTIPMEHAVQVLSYANIHNLKKLESKGRKSVLHNFEEVVKRKYHLDLDVDNLFYCLNGSKDREDVIQFGSEISLFYAIVEWVMYDEESRTKHVEKLMEVIRFPLMSEDELGSLATNTFIVDSSNAQELIRSAQMYHQKPTHERILDDSKSTILRRPESVLIADFVHPEKGAFTLSTHQGIHADPIEAKWKPLENFPGTDLQIDDCTDVCTLVVNGFLIVLVGETLKSEVPNEEPSLRISPRVFDPRKFEWSQLATCGTKTQYTMHTAAATKENMVVFMNHGGRAAELLIYSLQTNTWRNVPHESPKLKRYSVCASDNSIYAFCVKEGWVKGNVYDPNKGNWVQLRTTSENSISDRSESFMSQGEILHVGVGQEVRLSTFTPGPNRWYGLRKLWLQLDNPELLPQSVRILCGDNLFSLSNREDYPYTTEFVSGKKFAHSPYFFMKHEGLPMNLGRGCLAVALRMPLNQCDL